MADIEVLMPLIKQFLPFAQKQMGFDRPPKLFLKGDATNAADPFGKTGFYDPEAEAITLFTTDRHPKDILRSLSHELMHHTQNCRGDFTDTGEMGEGYAQNNPHMRSMEIEAYKASICFRDWEDSLKETIYYEHLQKGDKTMSTKDWKNGEIKTLLSEAWGFKMDLNKLNENQGPEEVEEGYMGDQGKAQHRELVQKCIGLEAERSRVQAAWMDPMHGSVGGEDLDKAWQKLDDLEKLCKSKGIASANDRREAGYAELAATGRAERQAALMKKARAAHARQDTTLESKELYEYSAAKHRTAGDTIEEELEECGEMPDEGEVVIDIAAGEEGAEVGAEDPAARVGELMDELKGLLMQLTGEGGGEEEVAVAVDEPMEERRAKGRSSARNQRGAPDPRQRPGAAMQEKRMRALVRKAIKEAMK
jgi:hypothetical protein